MGRCIPRVRPLRATSAADNHVAVSVNPSAARLQFGAYGDWDVVSDASRFLIALAAGADHSSPYRILQNSLAQLGAASR